MKPPARMAKLRLRAISFVALLPLVGSPDCALGQIVGKGLGRSAPEVPVYRHSPLFGPGPQTVWKGGWGIQMAGEFLRAERGVEEERAMQAEIFYGVTEDFNVLFSLPVVQRKSAGPLVPGVGQVGGDVTGVGDALLRVKYRFWQDLFLNGNHQAALLGGVKLPLGRSDTEPAISSGSVDFLLGAAVSRETHRYYGWASVLARVNTEALGLRKGNEVRYDLALGLRPYVPDWKDPDLMIVLEFVGVTAARSVTAEGEVADSGGTVLAFAPGFWLTYRNWALKGGVKLPFVQNLNGTQPELDFQTLLALELHVGG